MTEPLIKDCACGKDHMEMPTDTDTICGDSAWSPCLVEGCTHETFTYDLVCLKHKRHEPCRSCLKEKGITQPAE